MEELIKLLRSNYPGLAFVVGPHLCWSPDKQEIYYDPSAGIEGIFGVLHEVGHARLGHTEYTSDLDLLKKEVLAWEEARQVAKSFRQELSESHIQDCLDTYRDWVHRRSLCPRCSINGVQTAAKRYECLNCEHTWQVTDARFFRPYRSSKQKKPK